MSGYDPHHIPDPKTLELGEQCGCGAIPPHEGCGISHCPGKRTNAWIELIYRSGVKMLIKGDIREISRRRLYAANAHEAGMHALLPTNEIVVIDVRELAAYSDASERVKRKKARASRKKEIRAMFRNEAKEEIDRATETIRHMTGGEKITE